MKRTDLPDNLQRLVATTPYAAMATVNTNGTPWNTPVFCCFDDELNFYWASAPTSRHSKNITDNPRIFVVLYDTRAHEGEGQGLYLEMTAKRLETTSEIRVGRQAYTTLFGESGDHKPFFGICERRIYKASPLRIWANADGLRRGQFIDVRIPIATST